jgi:hypothetical protein
LSASRHSQTPCTSRWRGTKPHTSSISARAHGGELYDPARKIGSAIGNFLSENVIALKNFAEYIAPGELLAAYIR